MSPVLIIIHGVSVIVYKIIPAGKVYAQIRMSVVNTRINDGYFYPGSLVACIMYRTRANPFNTPGIIQFGVNCIYCSV